MRAKVQTKLFFGSIAILLATVAIVSIASHYFITQELKHVMEPPIFSMFKELNERRGNPFEKDLKIYLSLIAIIGSILAIIASFSFSKYLVTPIRNVIETTKKISKGDYKTRVSVNSKDEIGELCNSVN